MKTPFALMACLGLLSSGCILVTDDSSDDGPMRDDAGRATGDGDVDDDDDDDDGDTGGDDAMGSAGDTGGGGTGGGSDGETGEPLVCSAQILGDPGFEGGSPSKAWAEASELFESPLCDGSCTEDEGAGPLDGEWFAWFGGVAEAERASLTQSFTADGVEATLTLHVEINAASGTGQDALRISIGDTTLLEVTDADAADYNGYTEIALDVSEWADGAEHTLQIAADLAGEGGVTSFFVDELSIVACSAAPGGEETGAEPDGDGSGSDGSGSDGSGSDGSGSDGSGSDGSGSDGSGSDGA